MELKENNVVLFKNDKKETDAQPDYKGQVNVNGKLMDIALWVRVAEKTGKKYFSGKLSEPYKKSEPEPMADLHKQAMQTKAETIEEPSDELDLPF